MSSIPESLRYSPDHEYVQPGADPSVVTVGITDYAQGELGDIVFLSLPKPGTAFKQKDVFGTVEAVKAVSELYMPVSGEVVEVNPALDSDPGAVNRDPYGDGWLIRVKLADPGELTSLLDASAYRRHVGE
ncbi:MAG: glycine cleavage system protein GcvH [Gemmatimonadota bacterium]